MNVQLLRTDNICDIYIVGQNERVIQYFVSRRPLKSLFEFTPQPLVVTDPRRIEKFDEKKINPFLMFKIQTHKFRNSLYQVKKDFTAMRH